MHLSNGAILCFMVIALVWRHSVESASVRRPRAYRRPATQRSPKKTIRKTVAYTYGLTIAEISRDPLDGALQFCNLTELKKGDECEKELDRINRPVRHLCAKKMMNLIVECIGLQNEEEISDGRNVGDDTGFFSGLKNRIYPGTKWCGPGHIAKNYFDLGSSVKLDKCCRAHDYCPIKIKALSWGYGETNWSLYTKSHCDCDTDFFNCLVAADSQAADTVGSLYFNAMKVQCLREDPGVKICPQPKSSSDRCPSAYLQNDVQLRSFEPEYVFREKNRTRSLEESAEEQQTSKSLFSW
ncbi:hypothetical protein BIW11_06466 [Tropilaelaps mercedesae]|uniref:Phospholipase A2-like central domain-containing protein n=1 Tax=Tropilaelaps mercedesae TaxID=418985 RepID=A0A1V9XYA5_9ACAR|nr:hypothetical protein BIW11_06466 [Tropilaelaps mercedesae]